MLLRSLLIVSILSVLGFAPGEVAQAIEFKTKTAATTQRTPPEAPQKNEPALTQEQKMKRRFPQPVRVGDLVGLPVLDWADSTIGYVSEVARTSDGKIVLIVPYGRMFGWVPDRNVPDKWRRPVAVPIEVVAILARQLAALDMSREEFDKAPTWNASQGVVIALDDKISIALGKR